MSSHHIVREKQEPALLVLGLKEFSYEMLGQLLEWSPTIIATPDTVTQLHNNQIKIDWLMSNTPIGDLQLNVKLIAVEADDYLDTALKQLVVQGYNAVNIVADELVLNKYLFYADKIDLVIYRNNEKIFPVKSGFSKWKPAGEIIRLITIPDHFSHSGLNPLGDHVFETNHDGFFTLQFSQPYIFIEEML